MTHLVKQKKPIVVLREVN